MDVAYRFPLHKYRNEIRNIDFRIEGYFRINIETDENVETKHFTIGDDYGKSLNDLLTTIQGNNRRFGWIWFFVHMLEGFAGQRGEDNLVGVQIGYNSLYTISTNKGKPRSWKKSIVTFVIMYPEALRFVWMNEDLSFIMKREMDIKMEGDYIYMSILPKIWKDVCKAARSKYPFPREYNQPRIQKDKRTVPGCEALKWNRAYAIDALGLHTMSKGHGGNQGGRRHGVAVKVEIRVEVAMCLQVDNAESMA
ncbi:symplekin isoform X2 [Tanacetum coccineum]|uniref:Symplekin isoform X2 n=1 Tax=Tanacetum coccineum TaxID=301880 RepID=A0ABQ5ETG0_9ASTR